MNLTATVGFWVTLLVRPAWLQRRGCRNNTPAPIGLRVPFLPRLAWFQRSTCRNYTTAAVGLRISLLARTTRLQSIAGLDAFTSISCRVTELSVRTWCELNVARPFAAIVSLAHQQV